MIFAIDHIVFCATPEQKDELLATLKGDGFATLESDFHLDFPEDGAASDSVGYQGGASLEFVYQTGGSTGGPGPWFAETPRVMGLGFSSDDFAADTDWDGDPGHWTMAEQQGFPNSAGPHEHKSDFYVFVMNRSGGELQFPELTSGPRLRKITLAGQAAPQWREKLGRWLKLAETDGGLTAGDTELVFTDGPHPNVRATLTFEAGGPGTVALSSGSIELAG